MSKARDAMWNEVYMFSDAANYFYLPGTQDFVEVSNYVRHQYCETNSPACAPRVVTTEGGRTVVTTDIKLRRSEFDTATLVYPVTREDAVRFNACGPAIKPFVQRHLYHYLVHEAGHAWGIGYGTDVKGQEAHHSLLADSIVSYRQPSGFSCSPYPFDVLAVYALYQRLSTD